MVELLDYDWKFGLVIIIGIIMFFDIVILFVNLTKRSGPGGCSDINSGGWITFPGPLNLSLKQNCTPSGSDTKAKCGDLGRWKHYTDKTDRGLCGDEIDKVWKDAIEQNVVKGYNTTQLLAYVIVPTITILGIIYGFLAMNMNKSEWTFWIMIATIMATGITSIAYDTDIAVLPTQQNPLEYISSKLKLGTADELEFSFISKKQDGDECLIKGTAYGATAAITDTEPISYTGDCNESDVPF